MTRAVRGVPAGEILVDASYLLAYLDQDAAAQRFGTLMGRMVVTSVNLGETFYKVKQLSGVSPIDVEQALYALGVRVIDVDVAVARQFDHLKDIDARSRLDQRNRGVVHQKIKSLSLGDLTCLGAALVRSWPVLTGDKHWTTLQVHGLSLDVYDFRDKAVTF